MSLDKSLKGRDPLTRHRNVLTRVERIEHLKETGLWTEESKATGLPKVAHRKIDVGKKDKAKKPEQEQEQTPEDEKSAAPEEKK